MIKLNWKKETVVSNISEARNKTMIDGFHAVLSDVWESGSISHECKEGLAVSIWKGRMTCIFAIIPVILHYSLCRTK